MIDNNHNKSWIRMRIVLKQISFKFSFLCLSIYVMCNVFVNMSYVVE